MLCYCYYNKLLYLFDVLDIRIRVILGLIFGATTAAPCTESRDRITLVCLKNTVQVTAVYSPLKV